jgi:hypothetical protein
MLAEGEDTPPATAVVLGRLLPELRDLPIANRTDVRPIMPSLTGSDKTGAIT